MSYEPIRDQHVKIREVKKCVGCLTFYSAGTRMRSRAYKLYGDFHSDYLCDKCEDVLEDWDDDFMEGQLKEYWNEIGETP